MSRHSHISDLVPVITLAELPAVARQLAAQVRGGGFQPDVIVYVERGARLLAAELCREFRVGAVAVTVQRRGGGFKRLLAGITGRFPRALRDTLRKLDERWFWSRAGGPPRVVHSAFSGSLAGCKVLLVDDAADSGRTISGCLAWIAARGAAPSDVRVAVLAATTPAGRTSAHFWILERNSRLPWSSDSSEKSAADAVWLEREPPAHD